MPRVVVVGLDGVPYSFIEKLTSEGHLPVFGSLLKEGSFRKMNSVMPTVSSVAWSTYMTGRNPGGHGIYGFIDTEPNGLDLYVPLSTHLKTPTLWDVLGAHGKRVLVMNVPVTYPPREVNGVLVSGVLATKVEKATYPREIARELKEAGYRIDVDPWNPRKGKMKEFLRDLDRTLERRFESAFRLMEFEPFDFVQLHVMGTDRINHFLWDVAPYQAAFLEYYEKIDVYLGRVKERLADDQVLVVLSDHGFCRIEKEIDLNVWLLDNGYLKWRSHDADSLRGLDPESSAYSLPPGRIYLRKTQAASDIAEGLTRLENPETGEKIVRSVFERDQLYSGDASGMAPDLVAVPHDGFDLKASFGMRDSLTGRSPIVGMHTYDDAFIYLQRGTISEEEVGIVDIMPTILDILSVPAPADLDGSSCL
jgi:predicted AlkP superfamily phosphohydrolase/phosphomutase